MSLLIIGRGKCTMGRTERDTEGNIAKKSAARWEPDPEGGSVAICRADPDTMEPLLGPADMNAAVCRGRYAVPVLLSGVP